MCTSKIIYRIRNIFKVLFDFVNIMPDHAKMKDLEISLNEIIYPSQFFYNNIFGIENDKKVTQRYFDETDKLSENPSYIRFELMVLRYRKLFMNYFYNLLLMRPSQVMYLLDKLKEMRDQHS